MVAHVIAVEVRSFEDKLSAHVIARTGTKWKDEAI